MTEKIKPKLVGYSGDNSCHRNCFSGDGHFSEHDVHRLTRPAIATTATTINM